MTRFASWTSQAVLWAALLALSASPAHARPTDDFRQHYDHGMRLYQEGQLESAIEEFKAAYAVKQLPRLLYNMARAHFQLGHSQEALDLYQQYLAIEPNPPVEIHTKVQENMAQAQAMLDAAARMKAKAPPAAPHGPEAAPPAPPLAQPPPPPRPAKAGPILLSVRAGPAIPLAALISGSTTPICGTSTTNATCGPIELAFGLEAGFALNTARTVYLLFSPQFQLERVNGQVTSTFLMAPLGIQVDIPIRSAPGLYLYPRLSVGYTLWIVSEDSTNPSSGNLLLHTGVILPEFGIKYVIKGRVNIGFEAFSMPIIFNSRAALFFYRPLLSIGVNL